MSPMSAETSISGLAEFLAAHAPLLESLYVRSQAARWHVSYDEFAEALYRSASHHFGAGQPPTDKVETYFRALHLEDLAFACALRRGFEAAWEQFVAEYRPVLHAAARAIVGAAGEARARELADSLYAELYGLDRSGAARKHSLLEYFHGRSKLATWLRTVLAQRHVDAFRASRPTAQPVFKARMPPSKKSTQIARGFSRVCLKLFPKHSPLCPRPTACCSRFTMSRS